MPGSGTSGRKDLIRTKALSRTSWSGALGMKRWRTSFWGGSAASVRSGSREVIGVVAVDELVVRHALRPRSRDAGGHVVLQPGRERPRDPAGEGQLVVGEDPVRAPVEFPVGVHVALLLGVERSDAHGMRKDVGLQSRHGN